MTFDATDRKIPGSPNTNQTATPYTYTVTDSDAAEPDSRSLDFTITVEDESQPDIPDIANQVYYQGQSLGSNGVVLPAANGGNGMVTYSLTPALPNGLSFNAATRTITGIPSALASATTYTLTATDSDTYVPDSDTETFTIEVLAQAQDLRPTFDSATIAPQILIQNQSIGAGDTVALPEATGGNGTLSYSISPDLPDGMSMNRDRQLVGTPTTVQSATTYTYRATDSDTVNPDSATLTFTIEVAADLTPNFNGATIPNQLYIQNDTNVNLTLPVATGGNGALTYSLTGNLPTGLTFNANSRKLTGTPSATWRSSQFTYTATDSDSVNPDSVSLTFNIKVDASDSSPNFDGKTIDNQLYIANQDRVALNLPAAIGGNAPAYLHTEAGPARRIVLRPLNEGYLGQSHRRDPGGRGLHLHGYRRRYPGGVGGVRFSDLHHQSGCYGPRPQLRRPDHPQPALYIERYQGGSDPAGGHRRQWRADLFAGRRPALRPVLRRGK